MPRERPVGDVWGDKFPAECPISLKMPMFRRGMMRVSHDRISIGGRLIICFGLAVMWHSGSLDKNGTIVGVIVSAGTGAREGAEIKLADTTYYGAAHARWTPDMAAPSSAWTSSSGTPNLWSRAFIRSGEAVDPLYLGCGLGLRLVRWTENSSRSREARDQSDAVHRSPAQSKSGSLLLVFCSRATHPWMSSALSTLADCPRMTVTRK